MVLAALLAAGGLGLALLRTTGPAVSPVTGAQGREARESAGAALVTELAAALRRHDVGAAGLLGADDDARAELAALVASVRALGVRELALTYVGDSRQPARPTIGGAQDEGPWVADVRVTWRYRGDRAAASLEVPLTLVEAPGGIGAAFVTARPPPQRRTPLWLAEPVGVRRGDRSLLVAPAERLRALDAGVRAAAATVAEALPAWGGDLVVEAPASLAGFLAASGSDGPSARVLAAVTAPAVGSTDPAGRRVFVNPVVFDRLGPRARQIVLTHEATHVALGPAGGRPAWLSEGFADVVALEGQGLPIRVSASEALAKVRRDGPPSHLPRRAQLEPGAADVGAAYEAAWLACRLIASRHGRPALARLVREAAHGDIEGAFARVLGTTVEAFTDRWRARLVDLAGA